MTARRVITGSMQWAGREVWKSFLPHRIQAWNFTYRVLRGPYRGWNPDPEDADIRIQTAWGCFRPARAQSGWRADLANDVYALSSWFAGEWKRRIEDIAIMIEATAEPVDRDPRAQGYLG